MSLIFYSPCRSYLPMTAITDLCDTEGYIRTRIEDGEDGHVFCEQVGHVAYLIIDGPTEFNAFSPAMYKELRDHLRRFRDDEDLWVAVLCGAGRKAFSVGGDLKKAMGWAALPVADQLHHFWYPHSEEQMLTSRISSEVFGFEVYKPVIAAINGYCLGAAAIIVIGLADLRIAGEASSIGFTETRRGLAGAAGSSGIGRSIPRAWAMWMCLTGDSLDAHRGYELGLFNEVAPAPEVIARAAALADRLCANSPVVLRVEKELLEKSYDLPRQDLLRLKWVLSQVQKLGHDALEGQRAFRDKRSPNFLGW
jgi:E-phenylitaconyl-CoA hydratase